MYEFIKTLLSLSLSGTLLILLISLLKPIYRGRFSRRWQYYIWLVAALRFVLPFTPAEIKFSEYLETAAFGKSSVHSIQAEGAGLADVSSVSDPTLSDTCPAGPSDRAGSSADVESGSSDALSDDGIHLPDISDIGISGSPDAVSSLPESCSGLSAALTAIDPESSGAFTAYSPEPPDVSVTGQPRTLKHHPPGQPGKTDGTVSHSLFSLARRLRSLPVISSGLPYLAKALSCTWLMISLLLFLRKAGTYRRFISLLKTDSKAVSEPHILHLLAECENRLNIRRKIALRTSPLIASPLLTGFFHPCILLPDETASVFHDDTRLFYIFTHELIHYKRRDMYYKWLVQAVCCIHWFNPFVYRLAKETGRACELACDEAVTAGLDREEKISYGNTLLSFLHTDRLYKSFLVSVTLTEGTKELKERLGAIMIPRKKTKGQTLLTFFVTTAICLCFTTLGTHAQSGSLPAPSQNSSPLKSEVSPKFGKGAPSGQSESVSKTPPVAIEIRTPTAMESVANNRDAWERIFVETVEVMVKRNHQCTICGRKINLYQAARVYGYRHIKTEIWSGKKDREEPSGPILSTHPCYNQSQYDGSYLPNTTNW